MHKQDINSHVRAAKFKIEFMLLMLESGRDDKAEEAVTQALELLSDVIKETDNPVDQMG
jgi:hypothetical protein